MPNMNAQDLKPQLDAILRVWTSNPEFKLKEVTLEQFKAETERFDALLAEVAKQEAELTPLRNSRDALAATLANLAVRARAGIKGYFGDNSNEYELAGGTRTSVRKKRSFRKPQPAAVAIAA